MPAVRAARQADAAAIAAIYIAGIAERSSTFETADRTPDDVAAWLEAGERLPVLVADDGGDGVLGWARLAAYSDRDAYAGVGEVSVYVAGAARGQGVGRRLVEAVEKRGAREALRLARGRPAPAPRPARRQVARHPARGAPALGNAVVLRGAYDLLGKGGGLSSLPPYCGISRHAPALGA